MSSSCDAGAPGEATDGKRDYSRKVSTCCPPSIGGKFSLAIPAEKLPNSCPRRVRKVTPCDPGELRSCATVAEHMPRPPSESRSEVPKRLPVSRDVAKLFQLWPTWAICLLNLARVRQARSMPAKVSPMLARVGQQRPELASVGQIWASLWAKAGQQRPKVADWPKSRQHRPEFAGFGPM